ncbi:hypothetical protein DPMN_167223 [Dreissena polymorpha]|uniref:Uncharacterized protein n=1 Tax=Dreissena polymorpha TaxID=45954 RepID=A0A9D4F2V8_DREPO|nr:hypothetical protein DPMN_167223 [Dreissena polymorpha]
MPPRAKKRRAEVAQVLQAMGAEPRQRAVRAEPIVTEPEIDPKESSKPGTSEQESEKGWLNMYAQIPLQTRQKIWKGEFIDLRSLLPIFRESNQQKVQIRNGEIIVSDSGVIKNIERMEVWSDAFLMYMAIFLSRHRNKHLELIQYMNNIRTAAG